MNESSRTQKKHPHLKKTFRNPFSFQNIYFFLRATSTSEVVSDVVMHARKGLERKDIGFSQNPLSLDSK